MDSAQIGKKVGVLCLLIKMKRSCYFLYVVVTWGTQGGEPLTIKHS